MKCISSLCVLLLSLLAHVPAVAQDSGAILRCDPASVIKKIDGKNALYIAGHDSHFKECAIPLAPGSHTLEVCYDASQTGWLYDLEAVCGENRTLTVEAEPGHTYRLKLGFTRPWKPWIEDVTESEAGLSYDEPPRKPKPSGSKKERETFLVMPVTPTYAMVGLQKGVIRGKWFDTGLFGGVPPMHVSRKGVPDGYHIFRVSGGDTVGFISGQMMNTSILKIQSVAACDDFRIRVYEDIPARKVLYLGHLVIDDVPGGFVGGYRDDLAEARAYVDSHYPELAGRLEAAPFREALLPKFCFGMGFDLRPAPSR